MTPLLVAALTAVIGRYAPKVVKTAVDAFIKRITAYLEAHPEKAKELDTITAAGRGDLAAVTKVGEAPDALKKFLADLVATIAETIKRPVLRTMFTTIGGFVVDKMSDLVWDELFARAQGGAAGVMARQPIDNNSVSAWQHSLIMAAQAAGGQFADPAPALAPAAETTPADPAAPANTPPT